MSANLYYLMTMLPSLPTSLGGSVDYAYAISKIKEAGATDLSYLADLLEAEKEIEKCGLQYYVLNNSGYKPQLPEGLPEAFKNDFGCYADMQEADWLTKVYKTWFNLLIETGKKTGSKLLVSWAKWELALRATLIANKTEKASKTPDHYSELFKFVNTFENVESAVNAANYYRTVSVPFEAEKSLDQARLDYLRQSAQRFSFTIDELVAYMLELRIHNRYSTMRPEEGRRILEEVTKL